MNKTRNIQTEVGHNALRDAWTFGQTSTHCCLSGHVRTLISIGDCHMAYSEDPTQVNDPRWVSIPPSMCAALLTVPWISVAIHCLG